MWHEQRDRGFLSLATLVSKISSDGLLTGASNVVQRRVLSGILVVSTNSISKSDDLAGMFVSLVEYNRSCG